MPNNNDERTDDFQAVVGDVNRSFELRDVMLLSAVPVLLVGVYFMPQWVQRSMILSYEDPSVHALWTSVLVHRGFNHLTNNLLIFVVLTSLNAFFFILAGERRWFHILYVVFLVVFPPVLGIVNVVVLGQGTGAGLSGIVAAFAGLLPVSIAIFIGNRVSGAIQPHHAILLFLVDVSVIASIYSTLEATAGILSVTTILVLYDAQEIGLDEIELILTDVMERRVVRELLLFGLLLFLVSPVLLFPADLVQQGHLVNILSHYTGFALGVIFPVLGLQLRRNILSDP